MTADDEKQMQALFAAGDPAARLPELLPQRVAARLSARPAGRFGLTSARAAAMAVALVSSAGLGGVAVWVTHELKVAPAPVLPAPVAAKPKAKVAAAPADPLALEAGLVRAALEALQRGDADEALARLDERQRRFPAGALETEAAVARARALLLAHRETEALAAFDALPGAELTPALKLTFADRLVASGRCRRALEVLAGLQATGEEAKVAAGLKARCGR